MILSYNNKPITFNYKPIVYIPSQVAEIVKLGTDVNVPNALANTTGVLTGSHTLVAGNNRMVVVYAGVEGYLAAASIVPTVTYGGVSMTLGISSVQASGTFGNRATIFYLLEADLPSDGANDVVITYTGYTDNDHGFYISQYGNVAQEIPEDTDGLAEVTPADTTVENSITCSEGSWILSMAVCGNPSTGTWSHNESQIEILEPFWISPDGAIVGITEKRDCTSGTYTLSSTYSATGTRYTRVAMAIKHS